MLLIYVFHCKLLKKRGNMTMYVYYVADKVTCHYVQTEFYIDVQIPII